jgi:hypothetical protein
MEVNVYPVLFEINGVPVYAHGFFLNLAAFVGGVIEARVSIENPHLRHSI